MLTPLTLSALIAGAVALSSDILVSCGTVLVFNKANKKVDIENILERRTKYVELLR